MSALERHLQDIANARRVELIPYIFHHTDGRVQTGPFKGMTIVPRTSWGDGDTAAKLLGVYEDELHLAIEDAIAKKPDLFINIGCAEGYYAVGFSRRLPHTPGLAIDINIKAMFVTINNALANSVRSLDVSEKSINCEWLESKIYMPERPLLIVDCEGEEINLLDPVKVPSLQKSIMLVECHDCMIAGITDTLISRFINTHTIHKIDQKSKDPYQFEFLKELSDCDKWALVHEGRPSNMSWLYMVPKK